MNFAIVNLGCKVNRVESDAFASGLIARGCDESPEAQADIIVINTCTVTGEAEKKTRKAVRRALKESPKAFVIVTGCAAAIDADVFLAMDPDRVHVSGKMQVESLLDQLCGPVAHGQVPLPMGEGFRSRVGVKIQDGCNNACTYCIVHVARGRATSRPVADVVDECTRLAAAGAREIVLTGINLGSYRAEATDGANAECVGYATASQSSHPSGDSRVIGLADLLHRLLAATADIRKAGEHACRFRISSIEPRDVHDDLIELMAQSDGRICRHLHLPLQSGSSKVLREMHRPYTADYFVALVDNLYDRIPSLSLSTDIICGFPGESDQDFLETLDVAKRCRFTRIHVFPYSQRTGTPAADRDDQVSADIRSSRAATLRDVARALRQEGLEKRSGTVELALVEESGRAMTESYYEVDAPAAAVAGALVEVRL